MISNEMAHDNKPVLRCQDAKTVSLLFEECVQNYGDQIAVYANHEQMTYSELNAKSNILAHYLQQCGVAKNTLIALYLDRSIAFMIGMLAIVKAGAAYLPLDIDEPINRTKRIFQDSNPVYIFTRSASLSVLCETEFDTKTNVLNLDTFFQEHEQGNNHNPISINSANDLVCVIYTSGSTGTPKGCMIPHRGVVNLVKDTNYIQITPADRMTQIANAAFDAMTFEVWGALLNGASLYIVQKSQLLSIPDFSDFLKNNHISVAILTAAFLNLVVKSSPDAFDNLRYLMSCGEKANPAIITLLLERKEKYKLSALDLMNGYGPTECTTFATTFKIENKHLIEKTVPIGSPISNIKTYILDENSCPVSPGETAELYLSGEGVGLGYLNNSTETAKKFVQAPWNDKEILYKTGDLVYYDPAVGIVFVDRIDNAQVKIRGFSVALAEIESCFMQYAGVNQASVLVKKDISLGKSLIAYVSFCQNAQVDFLAFHQYLKENLPFYMLPPKIIQLPTIPLTANGKIDQKLLAHLHGLDILSSFKQVKPVTPIEQQIVKVLCEILHISSVSTIQNFFDLGLNSLRVAELCVELNVRLEITEKIKISDIFEHHTVQLLAKYIGSKGSAHFSVLNVAMNRADLQRKQIMARRK
jgi:amino acid adenylation domain-containing protein